MGALDHDGTPDLGEPWLPVLAEAGATGARIASADWAATTLGPLAAWPQSLRTAVGICLYSPFPVVLWWGPDFTMLYNDAYQAILGTSRPDALGRPGAAVWPEAWPVLGPKLSDVLAGRGATWSKDRPMLLDRDGHLRERFFTVSHTPIVDSAGVRRGVFTTVTETTGAVLDVARDLTDRQRSVRRAEALARFAGALSTAADRAAVMAAVTRYGPAVFDARTADCAVLADEHDGLDVVSARSDGTPAWTAVALDADSAPATAVRTNRFTATPVGPAAITDCCLVLRYGDGAALGAVEVRWDTAVARDDALVNLLDTVAGLTSQALQRAALSASAAAMATLAARLTVTRSPAEAIAVMVTEVAVALGARLPGLVIREDDGRVRHYNSGLPADLAARYAELTIDDPRPVVEVLRTGRRIILPDRDAFRDRYPDLVDHAGANGIRTTVALPLLDSRGRARARPRATGHGPIGTQGFFRNSLPNPAAGSSTQHWRCRSTTRNTAARASRTPPSAPSTPARLPMTPPISIAPAMNTTTIRTDSTVAKVNHRDVLASSVRIDADGAAGRGRLSPGSRSGTVGRLSCGGGRYVRRSPRTRGNA